MSDVEPPKDPDETRHRLIEYEAEFEAQNAELREAYAALSQSRDRYRELFESAPVALMRLESDMRIAQVNGPAEELLGKSRDKLVGRTFTALVSPISHAPLRANLDVVQVQRRQVRVLFKLDVPDRDVWVRAHAGPLELDGEATIFVAFADVTQQHLAEDALRTSEARFRSLFEASVDGIALLDGPTLTL